VIAAALLALLVVFDALMQGFRAAAGRDGRIGKRAYYRAAFARAALGALVLLAINAAVIAILVESAPDPASTWRAMLDAAARADVFFAGFAALTLVSIAFWLSPIHELRIVPTLVVLGPFTLLRPLVIIVGLAVAAAPFGARIWIGASVAGATLLALEHVLGLRHRERWRALV
jgi:hypothetical protein